MRRTSILLIGAGGYGNIYLDFFRDGIIDENKAGLAGVADPFAGTSPGYKWLIQNRIPIYDTPEAFFQQHHADLTVIAAPTSFHLPYSILAMENGSHVLCEKPLTSTVQEMDFLEREQKRLGFQLGVGFQWSFSDTMGKIKKDILSGVYGRPRVLKAFISWPRLVRYYQSSSWKGRVKDSSGNFILDSIVSNAAAHYLHNMFFLLGNTMETAAYPEWVDAELYRAKDIESFDTCFLKGKVAGGGFYYAASHATNINGDPKFSYEFERGTIEFNSKRQDNLATGHLTDGRTIVYGNPFEQKEEACKLQAMIDYIQENRPVRCTIPTSHPHLLTCNAVFDYGKVTNLPQETLMKIHMDNPALANIYCGGLYADMLDCYREGLLPHEKGFGWSKKSVHIDLKGYSKFHGTVFSGGNEHEQKQLLL